MRFLFILAFLALTWFACSDKDKLPAGVLPPQKMKEIMWDMIRAGEFLNSFVLYRDSSIDKTAESQKWYNKVYQLHHISKEEFDKSFTYYREHPAMMKTILDSLSKREAADTTVTATKNGPLADSTIHKIDTARKVDTTVKRKFDTLLKKKIVKRKINPV